ncbi:MAG: acetolactate synthase large subunit [SAR324 cluster bacterium]|nr:acetolactate synthase large subunit [SAR324 cluster bacterium]
MNGAEILMTTALESGIKVCFSNPGTTEMPLLAALDSTPGMRGVLGMFEGVCTGAADGYGRMKDSPAMTLLHLGPGLGNGLANLHNARRADTPIVNLIGDHATWHLAADAPLTMDIESIAKTVGVTQRLDCLETLSQSTADAVHSAMSGQVVSLIVPHDVQWSEAQGLEIASPTASRANINADSVAEAAKILNDSSNALLLLGGAALRKEGLKFVEKIQEKTGCALLAETFPSHFERGAGSQQIDRLPYFPEKAIDVLSRYECIVSAGAPLPVSFFAYQGMPSFLINEQQKFASLESSPRAIPLALEHLEDALLKKGHDRRIAQNQFKNPELPQGELSGKKVSYILAAMQPDNAIIVDESVTSGGAYYQSSATAMPHSLITLTGGAIGYGMPCATGAAIACPDRPVFDFQADGSAMYTIQALWTQAREGLDVTTLLCSNRNYNILQMEYKRAGYRHMGEKARALTELDNPFLDWVGISKGMGVPAVSVDSAESLVTALKIAIEEPGPHLIEIPLPVR